MAETQNVDISPVADLSYRDYGGPFKDPRLRFWVITKTGLRASIKKKGFWIWAILSSWFYIILSVILYFVIENLRHAAIPMAAEEVRNALNATDWNGQVLNGINFAQIPILLVVLLIGSGIIANDNRANALIMYLSKPITRLDYLLGKWLTIFSLVSAIVLSGATAFYLYGMMSLREFGFAEDYLLYPRILLLSALCGSLYASLIVGISSLFKQARLAGATMASLYLLTYLFTVVIEQFRVFTAVDNQPIAIFNRLFYLSVDGLVHGMGKIVLNTTGENPFGLGAAGQATEIYIVPTPEWWWFVPLFFGVQAVFLWIAWLRIRAVEVVG